MNRIPILFIACLFLSLQAVSQAAEISSATTAQETKLNQDVLAPFLQEHCVRCHGAEEQNGGARFDTMDFAISDKVEALHYQDVLDVLNGGDMPPEDEPQPSNAELEVVIGELTEGLFEARKRLASNGGKVVMRRLNRREYAATIRHLFGFEPPATRIPPNDDVVNFDTVGSRQFFTTSHFEEYYALAQEVLREGFKWAGVSEAVQTRVEQPEENWTKRFRGDIERWKGLTGKVVRLSKMREKYLARPMVESGVYLDEPLRHLSFGPVVDPRGSYRIRVRTGVEGEVAPFRRFIKLNIDQEVLAVLHVEGTPEKPTESVVEIPRPALLGRRLGGRVSEDRTGAWLSHYLNFLERTGEIEKGGAKSQGLIWIDSFSVEGPFYPEKRSFFDALLCPVEPTPEKRSKIVWDDKNARELIEKFAFEAFRRRKPASDYIDGLAGYFQQQRKNGSPFDKAMIDTLAIVLASPSFVYINEEAGVKPGSRMLSARDCAIRLAYFLTSAPPDEELYQAAKAGSLTDRKAYHKQVDRLLTGAKRRRFAEAVARQWADFTRLDGISVSDKKYPHYTSGLRHSMKQEVIAFFDTLIEQNLPVSNLIKSDFATVNAQLAVHYGIPGVTTNEFKPVKLPPDSPRAGYLTQGAFLVAGSNGERTSPAVRGMLLMSRFLNSPPAPPPPNVPELGSEVEGPTTNRKLVELHQTRAQCASCHRKMDTIGLALENFDLIGRYRENEMVGRDTVPVKISGSMPGGNAFNSLPEFQSTMMEHEEDLARNMVGSLLVYALGRDIEFTDEPYIGKIMAKLKPYNYRMKSMIHAVAESPLFFKTNETGNTMSGIITDPSSRRSFLRKGAYCLALPFLDSIAQAAPAASVPKRMIFLGGGYGFTGSYRGDGDDFYPAEAGPFSSIGLTKGMKPLERHQDDLTMVSNLTNLGVGNPHGGSEGYLNCGSYREHEAAISCDQLAARTIGKDTRFPSLVLTGREPIPGQGAGHGGGYSLSADDRGRSLPGIPSPLQLYRTLFAQKGDSPEQLLQRLDNRQSILDLVRIDGSTVRRTLAHEDAVKLDEYFTSIREIETSLQRAEKWATKPKMGAPFEEPAAELTGEKEIRLMLDMLVLAFQTDMTRIASYRLPVAPLISSLGISLSPHTLSHYGSSDSARAASESRDRKLMELFAWFLDRLKETKDKDGRRLYDSCIVSYGSNIRAGHGLQSLPALLSGGGSERIKYGRHVVLPKKDTSLANYWLTLLQQAGVDTPQFNYSTDVVSELLG